MITLDAGTTKADIAPTMETGIASLCPGDRPVLRPWSGDSAAGPFALGCNLPLPFSNRISLGGFHFNGEIRCVAPNLPGEAHAIHGDGFQREWQQVDGSQNNAGLVLNDGEIGPFHYSATVAYELNAETPETRRSVTNRGALTLPFGLGLLPWFPRNAATRLQFMTTGIWPETPDQLPATEQAVPVGYGGDWSDLAPLPEVWINTGFFDWDSRAQIVQGNAAASVRLAAWDLGTDLVVSTSSAAVFVCFEPVSHPVDAHNFPGQSGLIRLASGETLTAGMTRTWGLPA